MGGAGAFRYPGRMPELVVVPDESELCVALAEGSTLTPVRRFPSSRARATGLDVVRGRHEVLVHDGRWVTTLSARGDRGQVLVLADGALEPIATFAIEGVHVHALAMRDALVYAGGEHLDPHGEADKLFVGRVAPGRPIAWRAVELPPEVRRARKGIDAIVLDGDRMIAVDNVKQPKWILVYDLADPLQPRLVRTHDFLHQANGEVIARAALGPCLAILGVQFDRTVVTFHARDTLVDLGSIAPAYGDPDPLWPTLAVQGTRLYLPAGARGVGIVELASVAAPRAFAAFGPPGLGRSAIPIAYRPAPSGQPVRFVTPATGGLFLHTAGRGGADSEWLALGA